MEDCRVWCSIFIKTCIVAAKGDNHQAMTLLVCRTFVWEWKKPTTTNKNYPEQTFQSLVALLCCNRLWVGFEMENSGVIHTLLSPWLSQCIFPLQLLTAITQHCHDCLGISPAKLGVTKSIYLIYYLVTNRNMKLRLLWTSSMGILWFSLTLLSIVSLFAECNYRKEEKMKINID